MGSPAAAAAVAPADLRRLRQFMDRAGINRARLAEELGKDAETIRRWERRGSAPSPFEFSCIRDVLNLTDTELGRLVRWWGEL